MVKVLYMSMKNFIKSQKTDGEIGGYRLYVETNDGKFATIKMKLSGQDSIRSSILLYDNSKGYSTCETVQCALDELFLRVN